MSSKNIINNKCFFNPNGNYVCDNKKKIIENMEETCDSTTWNAGFGECPTYASGESNNFYCGQTDGYLDVDSNDVSAPEACPNACAQPSSLPNPASCAPPPPPEPQPEITYDPSLHEFGRCGPLFGKQVCDSGYYCNEENGYCGDTDAHKNAQASTEYDGPSFESESTSNDEGTSNAEGSSYSEGTGVNATTSFDFSAYEGKEFEIKNTDIVDFKNTCLNFDNEGLTNIVLSKVNEAIYQKKGYKYIRDFLKTNGLIDKIDCVMSFVNYILTKPEYSMLMNFDTFKYFKQIEDMYKNDKSIKKSSDATEQPISPEVQEYLNNMPQAVCYNPKYSSQFDTLNECGDIMVAVKDKCLQNCTKVGWENNMCKSKLLLFTEQELTDKPSLQQVSGKTCNYSMNLVGINKDSANEIINEHHQLDLHLQMGLVQYLMLSKYHTFTDHPSPPNSSTPPPPPPTDATEETIINWYMNNQSLKQLYYGLKDMIMYTDDSTKSNTINNINGFHQNQIVSLPEFPYPENPMKNPAYDMLVDSVYKEGLRYKKVIVIDELLRNIMNCGSVGPAVSSLQSIREKLIFDTQEKKTSTEDYFKQTAEMGGDAFNYTKCIYPPFSEAIGNSTLDNKDFISFNDLTAINNYSINDGENSCQELLEFKNLYEEQNKKLKFCPENNCEDLAMTGLWDFVEEDICDAKMNFAISKTAGNLSAQVINISTKLTDDFRNKISHHFFDLTGYGGMNEITYDETNQETRDDFINTGIKDYIDTVVGYIEGFISFGVNLDYTNYIRRLIFSNLTTYLHSLEDHINNGNLSTLLGSNFVSYKNNNNIKDHNSINLSYDVTQFGYLIFGVLVQYFQTHHNIILMDLEEEDESKNIFVISNVFHSPQLKRQVYSTDDIILNTAKKNDENLKIDYINLSAHDDYYILLIPQYIYFEWDKDNAYLGQPEQFYDEDSDNPYNWYLSQRLQILGNDEETSGSAEIFAAPLEAGDYFCVLISFRESLGFIYDTMPFKIIYDTTSDIDETAVVLDDEGYFQDDVSSNKRYKIIIDNTKEYKITTSTSDQSENDLGTDHKLKISTIDENGEETFLILNDDRSGSYDDNDEHRLLSNQSFHSHVSTLHDCYGNIYDAGDQWSDADKRSKITALVIDGYEYPHRGGENDPDLYYKLTIREISGPPNSCAADTGTVDDGCSAQTPYRSNIASHQTASDGNGASCYAHKSCAESLDCYTEYQNYYGSGYCNQFVNDWVDPNSIQPTIDKFIAEDIPNDIIGFGSAYAFRTNSDLIKMSNNPANMTFVDFKNKYCNYSTHVDYFGSNQVGVFSFYFDNDYSGYILNPDSSEEYPLGGFVLQQDSTEYLYTEYQADTKRYRLVDNHRYEVEINYLHLEDGKPKYIILTEWVYDEDVHGNLSGDAKLSDFYRLSWPSGAVGIYNNCPGLTLPDGNYTGSRKEEGPYDSEYVNEFDVTIENDNFVIDGSVYAYDTNLQQYVNQYNNDYKLKITYQDTDDTAIVVDQSANYGTIKLKEIDEATEATTPEGDIISLNTNNSNGAFNESYTNEMFTIEYTHDGGDIPDDEANSISLNRLILRFSNDSNKDVPSFNLSLYKEGDMENKINLRITDWNGGNSGISYKNFGTQNYKSHEDFNTEGSVEITDTITINPPSGNFNGYIYINLNQTLEDGNYVIRSTTPSVNLDISTLYPFIRDEATEATSCDEEQQFLSENPDAIICQTNNCQGEAGEGTDFEWRGNNTAFCGVVKGWKYPNGYDDDEEWEN
jgi:hypothetical protein